VEAELASCLTDLADIKKKLAALEKKISDCEIKNLPSTQFEEEKKSHKIEIESLRKLENNFTDERKSLATKAKTLSRSLSADPRSLFANNLVPVPKAHPKQIVVGVPFVDRGDELTKAWNALEENLTRQIEGKTHIILSGQTFGSGSEVAIHDHHEHAALDPFAFREGDEFL
jgi:hypothetical protein